MRRLYIAVLQSIRVCKHVKVTNFLAHEMGKQENSTANRRTYDYHIWSETEYRFGRSNEQERVQISGF